MTPEPQFCPWTGCARAARSLGLILCVAAGPLSSLAIADGDCNHTAEVREIVPGAYLRSGSFGQIFETHDIANVGFVVGTDCVAVIDSGGSAEEGTSLRCSIRQVTDLPVCYVINTHVHPDHLLGNQAFVDDQPVFIGHRNLPRALAILGEAYVTRAREVSPAPELIEIVPPARTVENVEQLDLGGRILELRSHSQAHTDNDLSVLDVSTSTLWAGDLLFSEHIPVLGGSASISGWIALTAELLDSASNGKLKRLVPGHGAIAENSRMIVAEQLEYLDGLRHEVREWIDDGGDIGPAVEQLGKSLRGGWAMFDEFHGRNVSYAYTELEWE